MTEKTKNTSSAPSRRKALALLGGGLLGATQLPKAWTQPVINSVVLPVHAQTTTDEGIGQPIEEPYPTHFRSDINFTVANGRADRSAPDSKLLSLLIPEAQAGEPPVVTAGELMIDCPDGVNFTAKLNVFNYYFEDSVSMSASGVVGGAPADLDAAQCNATGLGTISVTEILVNGAAYSIVLSTLSQEVSNGILPVGIGVPDDLPDCPF